MNVLQRPRLPVFKDIKEIYALYCYATDNCDIFIIQV